MFKNLLKLTHKIDEGQSYYNIYISGSARSLWTPGKSAKEFMELNWDFVCLLLFWKSRIRHSCIFKSLVKQSRYSCYKVINTFIVHKFQQLNYILFSITHFIESLRNKFLRLKFYFEKVGHQHNFFFTFFGVFFFTRNTSAKINSIKQRTVLEIELKHAFWKQNTKPLNIKFTIFYYFCLLLENLLNETVLFYFCHKNWFSQFKLKNWSHIS